MKKTLKLLVSLLLLAGVTSCVKQPQNSPLMDEVDKAINAFLENYASTYLFEQDDKLVIEYHVVSAVKALAANGFEVDLNNYLTKEKVLNYYDSLEYSTPSDAFKAVINSHAFGVSYDKASLMLESLDDVDNWSITTTLSALNLTNNNPTLKTKLLNIVNVIKEEDYRDADYAGAALMVTSKETLDKTALFSLINENLTKDGVSSWGSANACSTAYAILGLVASNIDPTSAAYTVEGTNLVQALLKYQKNGAFAFKIGEEIDLAFSTPQAFSALVAYKIYIKTSKPFVLFG